MKIILRQATIHDKSSVHDNSCCDVLIQDGIIQEISSQILEQADAEVTHPDLHVSNGWVDIFTFIGQPGYEHRETLKSGAAAAQAGGFTDIFMLPNTSPVISTHAQVSYLTQQSKLLPVNILPLGSVTAQTEGKALSEMYDMYKAGAVAFSEGLQTLENTGIMLKALQYLKTIDGTIIQVPGDKTIAPHGLVNEGITSTLMGLPGKPAIAEEICVARDIEL
ncbi:MAG: dihydroorotase, partial [Ferruginibacter sp.]